MGVLIVDEFVPLEKTFMLWIVCSKSTSVNGAKAVWLTKDTADHDIVCAGEREVLRSKTARKISEHWDSGLLINMQIGPWDWMRGVQTVLQETKPVNHPIPRLHVSPHGVEVDLDKQAVRKYAKRTPRRG